MTIKWGFFSERLVKFHFPKSFEVEGIHQQQLSETIKAVLAEDFLDFT